MSYDVYFFRVPAGVDAAFAYEELLEREEASTPPIATAGEKQEMERVARALLTMHAGLERFEPERPTPWIELNDNGSEVQLMVNPGYVVAYVPYRRERGEQALESLAKCVPILRAAAEYSAWDPQIDKVLSRDALAEMLEAYRGVDLAGAAKAIGEREGSTSRPWWKFWAR